MLDRLFIAIDPPENIRSGLARICHGIKGARWTPEEQLHLTLRFIGEVDRLTTRRIDEVLRELKFAPFSISLAGCGVFPPRGMPRILWAGLARSDELFGLQARLESRLVNRAGIAPEERKYHPHLTLARLKKPATKHVRDFLALHGGLASPAFTVDRFHLYESRLTGNGAIHTRLETYDSESKRQK